MTRFYTFICCFLFSCAVRIDYIGTAYPRTQSVEVFVDEASIKKPYTIIGRGYTYFPAANSENMEKVQQKAIQKGLEKGADALLFQDQVVANNDLSVNTSTTTIKNKAVNTSTSTSTSPVVSSRVDIYYLKYN